MSTTSLIAREKPLSSFSRLSPKVSLYTPVACLSKPTNPLHPTTILLASWLNALPKHIQYYADYYTRLYPHARIILVTIISTEFLFQSEPRRRSDMAAAITALLAPANPEIDERLLIHSFSNGGAKRVYNIAGAYRAKTGNPLPVRAWVIDSAPGIPQFRRDIHALHVPARALHWHVFIPYMAAVYSIVTVVYVAVNWLPKWVWRELVWGPIEGLNSTQLIDAKCVKGFVYSKEDLAIDWRDVERHAKTAREKGWRVEMKCVHGAEHVQLFKGIEGEKGYWAYVRRIVELGFKAEDEAVE
jgi:hypothetical protein